MPRFFLALREEIIFRIWAIGSPFLNISGEIDIGSDSGVLDRKKGMIRNGPSSLQQYALGCAFRVESKSEAGLPFCCNRMFGRCPSGAVAGREILLPRYNYGLNVQTCSKPRATSISI